MATQVGAIILHYRATLWPILLHRNSQWFGLASLIRYTARPFGAASPVPALLRLPQWQRSLVWNS